MHKFKLSDVIDAIEKNGLPKKVGGYYDIDHSGKPIAACAMGQAAINLKVNPFSLASRTCVFRSSIGSDISYPFDARVFKLNDTTNLSFKEIADVLRAEYKDHLDKEFVIRK